MPLYPRAPIVEAIIEVRLTTPLRDSALDRITNQLKKKYSIIQDIAKDLKIEFEALSPKLKLKPVKTSTLGRRFSRDKGDSIIQVYPDQFVFSMFARYEGWDVFKATFDASIKEFIKSAGSISRIGMRFINRIDIPSNTNTIKIDDFVNISFNIPIAKTVEGFETAFKYHLSDKYSAIVRINAAESPLPNHSAIYVDIDVSLQTEKPIPIDTLEAELNSLRDCKNQLFEGLVTDRSRELFLKEVQE